MTIEAAISDLQVTLLSLSGMKAAPAAPIEGTGAFPFAVSYEQTGRFEVKSAGFGFDQATIFCEIHVARQMLNKDIALAMTFRDPFLLQLMIDPTLGGSVSTIQFPVRRTFGRMVWGGMETIGYRFEIDVKLNVFEYYAKVLSTQPGDLVRYWPLWEASGAVAADISSKAKHGTYSNVTLGQPGIGDGRTCPAFDGVSSYVNIYDATLDADFNKYEFSIMVWGKPFDELIWTDAIYRRLLNIEGDSGFGEASINKSSVNNRMTATLEAQQSDNIHSPSSGMDFVSNIIVASSAGNYFRYYKDGELVSQLIYPTGAWADNLSNTNCVIGARTTTPTQLYKGYLAHVALWKAPLSATLVPTLASR